MFLVYITCSSYEEAEKIAKKILEERLAACANIYKEIKSIYWWKGKLEEAKESILILKTDEKNLEKLKNRVKELHSYTIPAILPIRVEKPNREYLNWLIGEISERKE